VGVQNQALAGVGALAPATPTVPVVASQAPAPAPPPNPPAMQIAMQIAPLRLDADGVHRLTINLHPVDLGPVQVIAEIRNGEISMQLSGSTDAGNDALRDALSDLRRELQDSGFTNCSLDLRQGPGQQDQGRPQFGAAQNGRGGGGSSPASAPAPAEPAAPTTIDNGRLDTKA
jgi:flagellar hook-length control protein FliK